MRRQYVIHAIVFVFIVLVIVKSSIKFVIHQVNINDKFKRDKHFHADEIGKANKRLETILHNRFYNKNLKPKKPIDKQTIEKHEIKDDAKSSKQANEKPEIRYYSQSGQDKWIDTHLRKQNGVYVEFGSVDGLWVSNTAYFAFKYNWTGVLVEPDHRYHKKLKTNRPEAKVYTGVVVCPKGMKNADFAVSKIGGWSGILSKYINPRWREEVDVLIRSVKCVDLNEICPDVVDLMAIDTEGSELSILKTFDFESHHVDFFQIEVNFETPQGSVNEKEITEFMNLKGYDRIKQFYVADTTYDNFYRRRKSKKLTVKLET